MGVAVTVRTETRRGHRAAETYFFSEDIKGTEKSMLFFVPLVNSERELNSVAPCPLRASVRTTRST